MGMIAKSIIEAIEMSTKAAPTAAIGTSSRGK